MGDVPDDEQRGKSAAPPSHLDHGGFGTRAFYCVRSEFFPEELRPHLRPSPHPVGSAEDFDWVRSQARAARAAGRGFVLIPGHGYAYSPQANPADTYEVASAPPSARSPEGLAARAQASGALLAPLRESLLKRHTLLGALAPALPVEQLNAANAYFLVVEHALQQLQVLTDPRASDDALSSAVTHASALRRAVLVREDGTVATRVLCAALDWLGAYVQEDAAVLDECAVACVEVVEEVYAPFRWRLLAVAARDALSLWATTGTKIRQNRAATEKKFEALRGLLVAGGFAPPKWTSLERDYNRLRQEAGWPTVALPASWVTGATRP